MSMDTSTVQIGGTTKKSDYDRLLDNTIYLASGTATFNEEKTFKDDCHFSGSIDVAGTATIEKALIASGSVSNDLTIGDELTVNNRHICYENNDDVLLFTQSGAGSTAFYLRYPILCYVDNHSEIYQDGYIEAYQNSGWRVVETIGQGNYGYGITLAPGYYRLRLNTGGSADLKLYCTGVFGASDIDSDLYST